MSPPSKNKGGVKSESFVSKKKDDKGKGKDIKQKDRGVFPAGTDFPMTARCKTQPDELR